MTPAINVLESNIQSNTFNPETSNNAREPSRLEQLGCHISDIKLEINALKANLNAMEIELIELCGHRDEGITHFNSASYDITTTGKMNRKIINAEKLAELAPQLITNKPQINKAEFDALARTNPRLMQQVLCCLETKPAKTAVTVKAITE